MESVAIANFVVANSIVFPFHRGFLDHKLLLGGTHLLILFEMYATDIILICFANMVGVDWKSLLWGMAHTSERMYTNRVEVIKSAASETKKGKVMGRILLS